MLKKLFFSTLGIIFLLLSIAFYRTLSHTAPANEIIAGEVISIDEIKASQNLAASIRFKTISYQDEEMFPYEEFNNFIKWAAATYPEFHRVMEVEQVEHSLLFKWQGSDTTLAPILFEGHHDVVPIIPGTESLWQEDPFAGVISNNRIWGRGALDDKSGVIGLMEAATYLLNKNFKPKRTVYFSFGHNEEVGGGGAAIITEKLRQEGVQLYWSLGEGSFVNKGFFPGIDKFVAPINVAEKGMMELMIVAKSKGGHS